MPANSPLVPNREPSKRSTSWILASVTALLTLNWIAAIARFQVNVPIWDQWDFFGPIIDGKGWWDLFNFQHGPPRLGPGLVVDSWVMAASGWDSRIESLWIASLLLVSALLALNLKKQFSGRLFASDAAIPIIVLSLSQWGSVIAVPIASHSVFALMLLLLVCNVWLLRSRFLRFPLTGVLTIALTFSGFGLFAGVLLTLLLASCLFQSCLHFEKRAVLSAAAGLCLASAGWIVFASGYRFDPASDGFHFPHKPLFDYARFIALMFAHPAGWDYETSLGYIAGTLFLLSGMGIASAAVSSWFRQSHYRRRLTEIIVILTGSGFAFAAFAAVGRIHLGVTAGMASRYTTLLIPLWLGLLFWGSIQNSQRFRCATIVLTWVIAFTPFVSLANRPVSDWLGTAGLSQTGRHVLSESANEKIAWVSAYLRSADFREGDRLVGRLLHPAGDGTGLDRKLAWLKERKISFFKSALSSEAWLPWWTENRCTWLLTHDPEGTECWMADDCSLWLRAEHTGFVNFRVVQTAPGLLGSQELEITHRGITTSEPAEFLREIISFPVARGEQVLTLHSASGSIRVNPSQDTRKISYRLTDPWISHQPAGVEWILSDTKEKPSWVPRFRWRIISGFHGWEPPAAFGWTDARLEVEIRSNEPVYLNVQIDKRYRPVDVGPVVIRLKDLRIELPVPLPEQTSFSLLVPGSSTPNRIEIENASGAASPQMAESKDDTRLLALKLSHLGVAPTPRFRQINAIVRAPSNAKGTSAPALP